MKLELLLVKKMDAIQTKVQDAITSMINNLDKKYLRKMQVRRIHVYF